MEAVSYSDGKNSFFQQVSVAGGTSVNQIVIANREMTKNGYVYIYLSNESKDFKVYFAVSRKTKCFGNNLKVTHTRGPLLSEEGYYPFGMTMSTISSSAGTVAKNNYKFNAGTELTESFDINYYETYFRQYDAQLGRFTGVDALIELNRDLTPYHYAMNDPVFWNDPTGLVCEYYLPEVVVYASRRSGSGVSWSEWGSILDQLERSPGMGKEHAFYYVANPMFALKQAVELLQNKDVIMNLIKDYARKNSIDPFIIRKYVRLNFGF